MEPDIYVETGETAHFPDRETNVRTVNQLLLIPNSIPSSIQIVICSPHSTRICGCAKGFPLVQSCLPVHTDSSGRATRPSHSDEFAAFLQMLRYIDVSFPPLLISSSFYTHGSCMQTISYTLNMPIIKPKVPISCHFVKITNIFFAYYIN